MAGPRGRTAHRPQEPSKYEYEKHRIKPEGGPPAPQSEEMGR